MSSPTETFHSRCGQGDVTEVLGDDVREGSADTSEAPNTRIERDIYNLFVAGLCAAACHRRWQDSI